MKTNQKKVRKSQKGFTLIEMIVVIAIIGVLAAIITPSIMSYVNKSKISKNESNAKTIAMAAQAINADSPNPYKNGKATISGGATTWTMTPAAAANGDHANMQTQLKSMVGTSVVGSAGKTEIKFGTNGEVEYVLYSTTATLPGAPAAGATATASVTVAIWVQ